MKSVMSKKREVCIVAVDPGECGGIAIYAHGKVSAEPYKTDEQVYALVRSLVDEDTCQGDVVAYMEQVGGFMGDPSKSPGGAMFNFGNGYGHYRGVFGFAGVPLRLVPPQKWMRRVLPGVIGMEKGERKRALKQYAQESHPELTVTLALADALCVLEYGQLCEGAGEATVVIPSRTDFASDKKRAKKWCKANGWPLPASSLELVNYWRSIGSPEQ